MYQLKLNKRQIIYLSFYIILTFNLLLLLPIQVKKFINLHSQIRHLKKDIILFERDFNSKHKFDEEKVKLKKDILELEGKIISGDEISTVLAFISNKAKENAIEIEEISPEEIVDDKTISEGNFSYLPIKIEARGNFHNVAQFLNALEEGYYFLETREFLIKENSPYHEVNMTIYTLIRE